MLKKEQAGALAKYESHLRNAVSCSFVRMSQRDFLEFVPVYEEIYGIKLSRSEMNCPRCKVRMLAQAGKDYFDFLKAEENRRKAEAKAKREQRKAKKEEAKAKAELPEEEKEEKITEQENGSQEHQTEGTGEPESVDTNEPNSLPEEEERAKEG